MVTIRVVQATPCQGESPTSNPRPHLQLHYFPHSRVLLVEDVTMWEAMKYKKGKNRLNEKQSIKRIEALLKKVKNKKLIKIIKEQII